MTCPRDHAIPDCGRTLTVPDNSKHSAFIHSSVWLYSRFKRLSSGGKIAHGPFPYKPHGSRPPSDAKSHGGSWNTLIPGQAHHILPIRPSP